MTALPPLRLLVTFAEVARSGSMREAAARLNVTRPAITQALRSLEDHVGVTLFDRTTKPATLTPAGQLLAQATRSGLALIGDAIQEVRVAAGLTSNQVTVSCTLGMATHWLMPRLADFYARHPGIVVNVQAPPSDLPALVPGVDAALCYGSGDRVGDELFKLFDERATPVGQPMLVDRLRREGFDLTTAPLIHVKTAGAHHWEGWPDYLKRMGSGRSRGTAHVFDNYIQAVQAALDGRGLMLGWRSITDRLVREGGLTAWPDGECDLGTAYYLVVRPKRAAKPATNLFSAWLLEIAQG